MTPRNAAIMALHNTDHGYSEIAKMLQPKFPGLTRCAVAGVVSRNRVTAPDPRWIMRARPVCEYPSVTAAQRDGYSQRNSRLLAEISS